MKESIKNPKVNNFLAELDIVADLRVIETLVRDVTISEQKENIEDAVDMALANVKEILLVIKDELQAINVELVNHQNRFFASFFDPNISLNLENMTKHKAILDKRLDLLIKILTLKRETDNDEDYSFSPLTAKELSSTINFEFPIRLESSALIENEIV